MIVEGPVYINCVNVYDEAPAGEGGYPHSPKGGIGKNFVEFQILTNYGKGYHFYVQIYGKHTHWIIIKEVQETVFKYNLTSHGSY